MFGGWGTKEFGEIPVQTPDGPGVIKGIRKNKVHVKLNRSRGRPRHYLRKDVQLIDTTAAEEVGSTVASSVVEIMTAVPVPKIADKGAKIVLRSIFQRIFRWKTGY